MLQWACFSFWGLASGPECLVGLASFLGLASGPVSLIFRILSVLKYSYEPSRKDIMHTSYINEGE